jgi:hypothetical protein
MQMKQMVEIYIRLAELETTKEVQLITGLAILFIAVGSCLPSILIQMFTFFVTGHKQENRCTQGRAQHPAA